MPVVRARPPISTRHAFALAFELALRRDAPHSLIVPLLLRAPWALALAFLPPPHEMEGRPLVLGVASVALVGDFLVMSVIGSMLRHRARSVFDAPSVARPAPAGECYARGLRRVPWLVLTEGVRNFSLAMAASFAFLPTQFIRLRPESMFEDVARNLLLLALTVCMALPGLLLGFRLGVATEAVVLHERDLAGAFQRSFHMMRGHFERWLELIALSALLVLGLALGWALLSLATPWFTGVAGLAVLWLLVIAITPPIQYAWTFFYLRLVEIDEQGIEVGPTYARAAGEPGPSGPRLELVPAAKPLEGDERPA